MSAADGTYRVVGLPAGSYKLFISGWNTGAADQWYDKAASFEAARTLTVAAGQDLTGINPALVKGSTVSGKVSGAGGTSTPVSVLNTAGTLVKSGLAQALTEPTASAASRRDPTKWHSTVPAAPPSPRRSSTTTSPNPPGSSAAQTRDRRRKRSQYRTSMPPSSLAARSPGRSTDKAAKPRAQHRECRPIPAMEVSSPASGSTDASGKFSIPGLSYRQVLRRRAVRR